MIIMTHGSLFSGIGGFDLGFQWAGIETIWQIEIDDYCLKVLEKNFPNAKRFKDIREVGAHNLEKVDIISGGFPCQDISIAGRKAGITGKRSGLWTEMFRVCSELRPGYIVIENVRNLVGLGLDQVLTDLASIGYDAEWQIISARDLGAPHLRKRIWIMAYPRQLPRGNFRFIEKRNNKKEKWSADNNEIIRSGSQSQILAYTHSDGCRPFQCEGTKKLLSKNEDTQKFEGSCRNVPDTNQFDDDNPGYGTGKVRGKRQEKTEIQRHISDSTVQRLPDWADKEMEQRYPITEFKRPDWWAVEPDVGRVADGISRRMDKLRGLGNAIVPQIAEYLGKLILEAKL